MSRASSLIVLGILTILAPFSGLPEELRTLLIIGFGAAVLGIGVAERSKAQRRLLSSEPPLPAPPTPTPTVEATSTSEPPLTVSPIA